MTDAHPTEDHDLVAWARLRVANREWTINADRLNSFADEIERLRAELKEATRCKHPTKRGTGSVSTDGKIVTSELWCDTCGEKFT